MFHRNNTYGEILSVPEFADLKDYLFYENSTEMLRSSKDVRISENIPSTWNPDDMADGFERLLKLKKDGVRVLHQIYSEELMVESLERNRIPFRAKSVEHGFHGLGLGNGSEAQGWLEESVAFWKSL